VEVSAHYSVRVTILLAFKLFNKIFKHTQSRQLQFPRKRAFISANCNSVITPSASPLGIAEAKSDTPANKICDTGTEF
jgi:hypothetical protein